MRLLRPRSYADAVVKGIIYGAVLAFVCRWIAGKPPLPWLD